jgi:hypothetical protein
MTQQHHQNHATWECKYHVVFIPKYRKKTIFGVIKKRLGDVFHELARRRESKIEEIAQNVERKARNFTGTSFGLAATSSRRSGGTRR